MKDTTEKAESKVNDHTSSVPLLKKNKSFGWLQAAIIIFPLILVGIFIVFNTFAATLSPNTKVVQGIYTDLLNRTPPAGDSGVQYWATKMDKGTSYSAVQSQIKATAEYKKKHAEATPKPSASNTKSSNTKSANPKLTDAQATVAVENAYKLLNRKPDTAGLAFWKKKLTTGAMSVAGVNAYFAAKAKLSVATTGGPIPGCSREKLRKQFNTDPNGFYRYYESLEAAVRDEVYDLFAKYVAYDGTNANIDNRDKDKQVDAILGCTKSYAQLKKELDSGPIGKAFYVARDKRRAIYTEYYKPVWDFLVANYNTQTGEGQSACWQQVMDWKAGKIVDSWKGAPIICLKNSGWTVKALQEVGNDGGQYGKYAKQAMDGDPAGAAAAFIAAIEALKGAPSGTKCADLGDAVQYAPSCADGAEYVSAEDLSPKPRPRPTDTPTSSSPGAGTQPSPNTGGQAVGYGAPSGSNQLSY